MQTSCKISGLSSFTTISSLLFALIIFFYPATCKSQNNPTDPIPTLRQTSNAFTSIIEQAKPAVVNILVKKEAGTNRDENAIQQDFFENQLIKDFFGSSPEPRKNNQTKPQTSYGNGSGFLISEDGYIITNHHVAKDGVKITVHLQDKREYQAKVIGSDPQSDIALLKIDDLGLPVLLLGNSDTLRVGEWAIAIGSPLEFIQTVTVGIISAKGRSSVGVSEYEDFIQTDAAINPGNSGGPLLNIHGEVIGINTAFMTQSGGYMGVGFAVPSNMAKTIILQLQKNGKMTRGWLGVGLKDAAPADLTSAADQKYQAAARVVNISEDSPAEKAKLKKNDMIVALNETAISGAADFRNQIALTPPGTKVKITFLRNGTQKETKIKISKRDL